MSVIKSSDKDIIFIISYLSLKRIVQQWKVSKQNNRRGCMCSFTFTH